MKSRTLKQQMHDSQMPINLVDSFSDILKTPSGKSSILLILDYVDDFIHNIIYNNFNLDVSGFYHVIDSSAVKHALGKHKNDQIPLKSAHLGLIKDIIKNPDKLICSRKNRRGLDTIMYMKQYNHKKLIYIEEIRSGRHQLAMNTMYWKSR